MTCNTIKPQLVAFLHGELTSAEQQAIHQHLGQCESCLHEEMSLRKTLHVSMRYKPDILPDEFNSNVIEQIQSHKTILQRWSHGRRLLYAIAATILLVLGLEFVGYHVFLPQQSALTLSNVSVAESAFSKKSDRDDRTISMLTRLKQRYSRIDKAF